jgi:two-component system NtrC family response regulator
MEVKMIKKALAYHRNKISATAKSLGITRSALYRRLEKFNIPYDN